MKKNKFSHALCTGVLSSLLMLGLMLFAACDNGDGDNDNGPTVETPSISDVPAFDGPAVENSADAVSFLSEIRSANLSIYTQAYMLISSKMTYEEAEDGNSGKSTWDFTNQKTSDNTMQVTSKGKSEYKEVGDGKTVGDKEEGSRNTDTSATVIADIPSGDVTVKTGSKFAEKSESSQKLTVTAVTDGRPSEYNGNVSQQEAYSFGLSVTADGKGGKIIFSATKSQSFSGTASASTEITPSISGSLKVYGTGDAEVYSQTIDNEDKLDDALALIGYGH
ncbi:MAG: hypothetical protein LBG87_09380 [Spirochaetaceae bacterium]|jgi:hypothetical protein|nr:hypothetical protein [Spirochaetaceae bacterium]